MFSAVGNQTGGINTNAHQSPGDDRTDDSDIFSEHNHSGWDSVTQTFFFYRDRVNYICCTFKVRIHTVCTFVFLLLLVGGQRDEEWRQRNYA